jgi:hypothetical protein
MKREGKVGLCAVLLDMHKAYDHIEWVFLDKMLIKMGFDLQWIKMIISCPTTVEYRDQFNSREIETIKPKRGL